MNLRGNDRIRFENLLSKYQKNVPLYVFLLILSILFLAFGMYSTSKAMENKFFLIPVFCLPFAGFGMGFCLRNIVFDKVPAPREQAINIYKL